MENVAPQGMFERYKIEYANTFLKRTLGLMFKRNFDGKLVFTFKKPTNFFVHTCFMRFGIHVKFYNNNYLIKECDMKPWQVLVVRGVDCFTEEKRR